jgi:hypothetical protein
MSDFQTQWNAQVLSIESGWIRARRSNRVSLLPQLTLQDDFPRQIHLKFDAAYDLDDAVKVSLRAPGNRNFAPIEDKGNWVLVESKLDVDEPAAVYFDGLRLLPRKNGHSARLEKSRKGFDFAYTITLALESVTLSPVLAESSLLRAAQRGMSAREVDEESHYFSAACGPDTIVIAGKEAEATLEISCQGNQPNRDTVWIATLKVANRVAATAAPQASVQVNHAPFAVAQVLAPDIVPEAGTILAQWHSHDEDGAQWRFGVETVKLHLPPQAVGEAMVRGSRFRPADTDSPIPERSAIGYRFSRRTELTVRPSRLDRRYTVHPGDLLSVLRDAELERLVTELAYPLELTYQRTPELLRTVTVSEAGSTFGQPAVALPDSQPETAFSSLLAKYYVKEKVDLDGIVTAQRTRHLAARFSFRHRVAQFPLADANYPQRKLDLREGLSARLRSSDEGAVRVYPLPDGVVPEPGQFAGMEAFLESEPSKATLPAGLLYSVEFASELGAILRAPAGKDVQLMDLTLSVLGATGAMQAAFDEGRTVFDVQVENGQLSRLVKTRYGRIAAAWNKARHVVIYERSTAPGAQFQQEQSGEWFPGRPLLRKMEEYVEILEPHRLFGAEASAGQNRAGCLHAFHFATRTIYVNSAWGRDLPSGYEIPLYNELDTTGFYVKPWMGPVARGGGDDLAQHWHKKPQHLYFYTNTEPGKGADSDLWDAQVGVDLSAVAGLGAISSLPKPDRSARVPGPELLAQRWVPSYTLEAASDPRFAMEVAADGLSNLMHGRAAEELVAAVHTMQIERTMATSRVDFGAAGLLAATPDPASAAAAALKQMAAAADGLWTSAKSAAELKSIDATIGTILEDARSLWKTFGAAGSCDKLQQALAARVETAFSESGARLSGALAVLPKQQAELASSVQEGFKLVQRLPDAAIDAACAEGERAIANVRTWLARLPVDAKARKASWTQIEEAWLVFPVRAMLQRAAAALGGPLGLLGRIEKDLAELDQQLVDQKTALAAEVGKVQAAAAALLASVPAADFRQRVLRCIDDAVATVGIQVAGLQRLRQRIDGLKVPSQVQGLRQLRQHGSALLLGAIKPAELALDVLAAARGDVEKLDPNGFDALKKRLKAGIEQALDKLAATMATPVDDARTFIASPRAKLKSLRDALAAHQALLASGAFDAAIGNAFAGELATFTSLRDAIVNGEADVAAKVTAFDGALEALRVQLARPGPDVRSRLAQRAKEHLDAYTASLGATVQAVVQVMGDINQKVGATLQAMQAGLPAELAARKKMLLDLIGKIDCGAWDKSVKNLEDGIGKVVGGLRDQVLAQATSMFDQETVQRAAEVGSAVAGVIAGAKGSGDRLMEKMCEAVAPKASQAIKLTRLLSDPPQLPQLTIRTDRLECVYDDLKDQIETSPFVARLRELDAGIKELGIALPSRELFKNIVPDPLQGLDFSSIVRNAALDFENLFKNFKLPQMPSDAIRVTHHIDPKTRSANVKAEINHQFASTESLFDVMSLSMDVRKPRLVARTNFDISATESGKARTQALFSGDWILNFAGQPLVTFVGASIQYSDSGGFKFDLDPKKIEPHAALKFIGDLISAQMPELPENVDIIKNSEGMPIGASIVQNQAFGPLEMGGVSIGETVLVSGFGLRIVDGNMKIDASFGIGARSAPVFLQIGLYGGGGWLTASAWVDYRNGRMVPGYGASIGISLGSAKSFTLASVAHGQYALRLFIEAAFSSGANANSFIAGLQLTGSARILGYLSAYLNLLVQVEHSGGRMHGQGRLDVSIKVCWCYTVRISRTVQQDM